MVYNSNLQLDLSAEVTLMLDDSRSVPFLFNLKIINLYFIQNSMQITSKQFIFFSASHIFLKMILGVLGRLLNFNKTDKFLCGRPVFSDHLFLSYDYDFIIHSFILLLKACVGSNLHDFHNFMVSSAFIHFFNKQIYLGLSMYFYFILERKSSSLVEQRRNKKLFKNLSIRQF